MPSTLIDGNFVGANPVGSPRYEYPFRQNGDRASATFEQDYWQAVASYVPQDLGIPHDTLRDFYLVAETPPVKVLGDIYRFTRTYARLFATQTIPTSYLFSTPNFTPQVWGSTALPPAGVITVTASYGVIALSYYPGFSTAIAAAVTGYYGLSDTIGGYTGSPATVLNIIANSYVAGQRLLYRRTVAGIPTTYYFDISSVAGPSVNGTSTFVSDQSGGTTSFDVYVSSVLLTAVDKVRVKSRATTDYGQTYNLAAQAIDAYYIVGVSPGISSASSISLQQPYSVNSYLGAWALGNYFVAQSSQLQYWKDTQILKASYVQAALSGIT